MVNEYSQQKTIEDNKNYLIDVCPHKNYIVKDIIFTDCIFTLKEKFLTFIGCEFHNCSNVKWLNIIPNTTKI